MTWEPETPVQPPDGVFVSFPSEGTGLCRCGVLVRSGGVLVASRRLMPYHKARRLADTLRKLGDIRLSLIRLTSMNIYQVCND